MNGLNYCVREGGGGGRWECLSINVCVCSVASVPRVNLNVKLKRSELFSVSVVESFFSVSLRADACDIKWWVGVGFRKRFSFIIFNYTEGHRASI